MKEHNFGKVNNQELEDNYIKALKDENFKILVSKLKIKDEIKYNYTSQLKDVANGLAVCSKCRGIDNCSKDIVGLYEDAYVEDDKIKFCFRTCPYKMKFDKEKEYLNNIYFYKIPKDIKDASFRKIYKDDANRLEAIKSIKEFYDNYLKKDFIKGIYLDGNFGCGKTYLIAALFNELAKKDVKSTIIYFPEFLRSLKASFSSEDNEYEERFDLIKNTPLLLLDDIGAEKLSDWARDEVLGVILQYRMEEHLPTFFTSNLNLDELENHLSITKNSVDKVKARRIIERIKFLANEVTMISVNRRA